MLNNKVFLEELLNTLNEQIAVIDELGNILYTNESWIDFNNNNDGLVKPHEWSNVNYLDTSDKSANEGDELAREASSGIRSVIRGENKNFYLEYPCDSPDEERWFIMSVTQFIYEKNNYYAISHNNITKRKIAENKLSKNMIELKNNQDIMLQQSRLAAIGEIISMIAHQWRQPLSAIASTSIDMKMQSEFENFDLGKKQEAQKYETYINNSLDEINEFVQNLTTTIDDFRNFHKPNKESITVKLEDIISKSLNIISASFKSESIEIIEEYNSNQEVKLYDNEMMQVILNILKNAQDNFKEKSIKNPYIKIVTEDRTIAICDNGGGIPEDIIEKIFEPYFSTKGEKNGVGLGLYMSKTIVEKHHNGKLSAENTDDGVCFKMELGIISEE